MNLRIGPIAQILAHVLRSHAFNEKEKKDSIFLFFISSIPLQEVTINVNMCCHMCHKVLFRTQLFFF